MREAVRTREVQSPVIPIIAELIRAHPGTISLGQGVVHYGPPRQAVDAIPSFLADVNNHKYQSVHGVKALIEPLERKLASENGIAINTAGSRLFVTAGGNM